MPFDSVKSISIDVLSREGLLEYANVPWKPGSALISIGDSDGSMPTILHWPRRFLRLEFDDIALEMAEKTARFILQHLEETKLLVCQCEYGQSRSAAVAAATTEYLLPGCGQKYFDDVIRYSPNIRVYSKVLEQLRRLG
jgi:predicted protein tyrosine phosphatase